MSKFECQHVAVWLQIGSFTPALTILSEVTGYDAVYVEDAIVLAPIAKSTLLVPQTSIPQKFTKAVKTNLILLPAPVQLVIVNVLSGFVAHY